MKLLRLQGIKIHCSYLQEIVIINIIIIIIIFFYQWYHGCSLTVDSTGIFPEVETRPILVICRRDLAFRGDLITRSRKLMFLGSKVTAGS
jgi:hypothetical protein